MKYVTYSTSNEKKLIQAIQKSIGSLADGSIGTQTLSDIAVKLGITDVFPLTLQMYGLPVIVSNDLVAFSPKSGLKNYSNSMLGSFTYPRADVPCSILINNGKVINGSACHSFLDKPETVIYRLKNGEFGWQKAKYSTDLLRNILWAVGGMGLGKMYGPVEEGFSGSYSDVLRKTNHNVLGVKNGMVYGVYFKNKTALQIYNHCKDIMQFDMAILLDGGGLAGINGSESFAKINVNCKQGYVLQFV